MKAVKQEMKENIYEAKKHMKKNRKEKKWPGAVAHAYNPSTLGGPGR